MICLFKLKIRSSIFFPILADVGGATATAAAADPDDVGSMSIFFAGGSSDLVATAGASAFSSVALSEPAEAMLRGTCMMPLKAGEDADEGMNPSPMLVRWILVFFAEEEDEDDCGGANPETPPATERIATKDVLNFILIGMKIC
jgi:hypothetical protein